jgi:hypothetical protein
VLWGQSSLRGRVVDENETPVRLARIAVAAGGEVRQTTSDATGAFSLALPGPGDYVVSVQREGFYKLRDHQVHVDASNEVTLVLTPIREIFQSVEVYETPSPVDTGETARKLALTGTEVNDVPYSGICGRGGSAESRGQRSPSSRLRQCKYLNNVIEQDHWTVKKRVWLTKGYGSFQSAWRTL